MGNNNLGRFGYAFVMTIGWFLSLLPALFVVYLAQILLGELFGQNIISEMTQRGLDLMVGGLAAFVAAFTAYKMEGLD
jgi:hypothetical protein